MKTPSQRNNLLKVLDLSISHCGRMTAMALADLGYDVVRLPRELEKQQYTDRGKTLCSYASHQDVSTVANELAVHADIIIEDRPKDKLLTLSSLSSDGSDGIIYCWMPAFASNDDLALIESDELSLDAASAIHSQPFALKQKPCMTHMSVLSVTAAAYGINGILAALFARQRDGLGQKIQIPRSDVAYSIIELNALLFDRTPKCFTPFQWIASPWMKAYPCKGGDYLFFHAALKKHVPRLLEVMEEHNPKATKNLREIISEQTYLDATSVPSVKEIKETQKRFIDVLSVQTASFWQDELSKHGLCASKIIDTQSWFQHPVSQDTQQVIAWKPNNKIGATNVPGPMLDIYTKDGHIPFSPKQAENSTVEKIVERWTSKCSIKKKTKVITSSAVQTPALDGITVIDITQVIAGPTMGRTLAELGAKVHRIENPHHKVPFFEAFHIAYQSGKSQTTLDLNSKEGVFQLWELLDELKPDVVLQNFRPGAANAMGIGESEFRKRFPNIIFAHLSAYGTRGAWGDRPGWEQNAQAVTGAQWDFGNCPNGRPEIYPLPLNDLATGVFGATGVISALLDRQNTNPINKIEVSLTRTATWMQGYTFANKLNPSRGKDCLGITPFKHYYQAKDGWLFLHIEDDNQHTITSIKAFESLSNNEKSDIIISTFNKIFAEQTIEYWMDCVNDLNNDNERLNPIIIAPWKTMKQMLTKPRALKEFFVHRRTHENIGEVTETSTALIMKRTPTVRPLSAAPVTSVRKPLRNPFIQYITWFKKQAIGFLAILANK